MQDDDESGDEYEASVVDEDHEQCSGGSDTAEVPVREARATKPSTSVPRGPSEYDAFYASQCLCTQEEWQSSMKRLQTPLPPAFRLQVSANGSVRSDAANRLVESLDAWEPEAVRWCPGAYRLNSPSACGVDGRCSPNLNRVLLAAQRAGLISRQETASMLPVLAAGVRPDHHVLELCAAPGSKSMQILDAMHAKKGIEPPRGLHVANDFKPVRLQRLAGRARRTPASTLMTTCADARKYPNIFWGSGGRVRFDRVFCDVPCSGDGTVRKARGLLANWTPRGGLAHHGDQLAILRRGLDLLAPGGIAVYSTCALNPVECEAVVAAALMHAGESVEVVPIEVLGIGLADGLTSWKVPAPSVATGASDALPRGGVTYSSWEEVPANERSAGSVRRSMFPPVAYATAPEQVTRIANQLKLCKRLLPVHDDGGCFFLALLRRRENVSAPLRRGDRVIVKTNGNEAVVRGPGNGRFEGLLRITYTDGTHYNVSPDQLTRFAGSRSSGKAFAEDHGSRAAGQALVEDDGIVEKGVVAHQSNTDDVRNQKACDVALSEPVMYQLLLDSIAVDEWSHLACFFGLTADPAAAAAANVDPFPRQSLIYLLGHEGKAGDGGESLALNSLCVASDGLRAVSKAPNPRAVARTLFIRGDPDDVGFGGPWPVDAFAWRPCQEAASTLVRYCTRRVARAPLSLLRRLAQERELDAADVGADASWPSGAVVVLATDDDDPDSEMQDAGWLHGAQRGGAALVGLLRSGRVRLVIQKGFRLPVEQCRDLRDPMPTSASS